MIKGYRFLEAWIPWDGCIGDMEFDGSTYDQFEDGDSERFAKEWPTLYQVDEYKQEWIYFRIDMNDGTIGQLVKKVHLLLLKFVMVANIVLRMQIIKLLVNMKDMYLNYFLLKKLDMVIILNLKLIKMARYRDGE